MKLTAPGAPPLAICEDWREREAAHAERAATLTEGRRYRAGRGLTEPIEDFLYDYYSLRPRDVSRWNPGIGVVLPDDGGLGRHATGRWTQRVMFDDGREGVTLNAAAFLADRGTDVASIHELLQRTASRPGHFGCLGWHEWAMVYRGRPRHPLPLRLGPEGTDAVVEAVPIACTHYDAFRFFTPDAVPFNRYTPTRETQASLEQPACLHANMDCLKWALKLSPACPGELLLDTFDLAQRIRRLDMAASPYDCTSLGLEAVRVETAEGRAEYVAAQRAFAEEAAGLRARLLAVTGALLAGVRTPPPADGRDPAATATLGPQASPPLG